MFISKEDSMLAHKRLMIIVEVIATAVVLAIALFVVFSQAGPALAMPTVQDDTPTGGATVLYSGQLLDASGQALDGAYDFSFSLYDAAEGGTALWSETQYGVTINDGNLSTDLGRVTSIPRDILERKELWLSVSVRGKGETEFTLLTPRRSFNAAAAVSALSCPHSHFFDYWNGNNSSYGLIVQNEGVGDGIRAFSYSTKTEYAAVYAINNAATGYGTAVYGSSSKGLGVYAYSGSGDGLEASTGTTNKSAVYAHSTNGNGVWSVSGTRDGVYASTAATSPSYAALWAYSSGTGSPAAYGGNLEAAHSPGAWIKTDDTTNWIGLGVNGTLRILNGNCDGCALVYMGQNDGTAAIEKGDLVAAAGVIVDPDTQQPVLLIHRATSADDTVIGIAVGAAAPPSDVDRSGPETAGKSGVGVAATGEYIQVMVSGLTQVKVSGQVAMGSHIVPSSDGAVSTTDAINSVAQVMSEPDENGLVWVMVDAR
jgi:hypothetical protein